LIIEFCSVCKEIGDLMHILKYYFVDLIADTVMARQGFPRMGISACFGGPLFSILSMVF
jgi:hypothetical protein